MVGKRFAGCALAAVLGVSACGTDEDDQPLFPASPLDMDDLSAEVYDPTHIVEVDIDIAPADWDELRQQSRTLVEVLSGDCTAQPFEKIFTFFPATVTIDGTELPYDIGVRKKGFIGSLSDTKPSLKLSFDEYAPDQRYKDLERLTLNNSRQDPSYLNTCMGYGVFAAAGAIAPRCNFAHVTVNGTDMGVYVNVEPYKRDFLQRHFDDPDGNLYEGTLSDFRDEWRGTIEKKTNELADDWSDIDALVAAVEDSSDAALLDELDPILDVDTYLTFWATEVLVGHWDGYAGNRNNFYMYNDPADSRFRFLPWGADAVMHGGSPFGEGGPSAVVANGYLARRLYLLPETRDRYVDRMLDVVDDVWDEDALLAEVDRMESLIEDIVADTDGMAAFDDQVAGMRDFIETRRDIVAGELGGTPPQWTAPASGPPCFEPLGSLDATFSTEWGTLGGDPFNPGTSAITLVIDGQTIPMAPTGATVGFGENPGESVLMLVGVLGDGTALLAYFTMPTGQVGPGAQFDIDWSESFGALFHLPGGGADANLLGYFAGGTLTLNQAGTAAGAPVSGSVAGTELVSPPFAAMALPNRLTVPAAADIKRLVELR
jgi:spore coat protein CotH